MVHASPSAGSVQSRKKPTGCIFEMNWISIINTPVNVILVYLIVLLDEFYLPIISFGNGNHGSSKKS